MITIGSTGKNISLKGQKSKYLCPKQKHSFVYNNIALHLKINNYGKVHADLPGWWTLRKCLP